jgi:metal-responsive CopG/Arc/MetJ family transcriptional regulator
MRKARERANEYSSTSLPKPMLKEIARIIQTDQRLGFASTQEFIKEAVRRSIVQYGGIIQNEKGET